MSVTQAVAVLHGIPMMTAIESIKHQRRGETDCLSEKTYTLV
jgi:hypothetical protein